MTVAAAPAPVASPPTAPTPPPAAPPAAPAAPPPAAPSAPAAPPVPAGPTPAAAGAPTAYALSIPADATDLFDKADLQAFEARARTKNWTNEQAQAELVDFLDEREALHDVFRTQTEADETYGGAHLADTQRLAALALDKVRPPGTPRGDAFRALLVKTGYGNNLEVVSFLADLGKSMAEDRPGAPGPGAGGARDAATVLYGSTPPTP